MGFFSFLKPKRKRINQSIEIMSRATFPDGDADMVAATEEVSFILQNKVNEDLAKRIALKSILISRLSQDFTVERLKSHLAGYCLEYFSDSQVQQLYDYLCVLKVAMALHGLGPSKVSREGDIYRW